MGTQTVAYCPLNPHRSLILIMDHCSRPRCFHPNHRLKLLLMNCSVGFSRLKRSPRSQSFTTATSRPGRTIISLKTVSKIGKSLQPDPQDKQSPILNPRTDAHQRNASGVNPYPSCSFNPHSTALDIPFMDLWKDPKGKDTVTNIFQAFLEVFKSSVGRESSKGEG